MREKQRGMGQKEDSDKRSEAKATMVDTKRNYEATNSANFQFERSILGHFSDPTPPLYLSFLPHFMSTPKMQISRVCRFIVPTPSHALKGAEEQMAVAIWMNRWTVCWT